MDAPELSSPRLRAFLAVARASGFSSGARALGQSQSSVSQAVAALEEEIGQPLFVRAARGVELTEAGAILLEHAERALSELGRASDLIAGLGTLRRGRLRVGTSDTLATYLLPPLFAAFRERYPGVELSLHNRPSPGVAEAVLEQRVDLGVVSLPLPAPASGRSSGLQTEMLAPQRDVVIAPAGHRFAKRREIGIEQLVEERLVLLDPSTGARSLLEERLQKLGLRAQVAMEMSSVEVIKRMVELGFGISLIPAMAVEREVRERRLAAVRLRDFREVFSGARSVGLITHRRSPLSGAARAFAELARKNLALGPRAKGDGPRKT